MESTRARRTGSLGSGKRPRSLAGLHIGGKIQSRGPAASRTRIDREPRHDPDTTAPGAGSARTRGRHLATCRQGNVSRGRRNRPSLGTEPAGYAGSNDAGPTRAGAGSRAGGRHQRFQRSSGQDRVEPGPRSKSRNLGRVRSAGRRVSPRGSGSDSNVLLLSLFDQLNQVRRAVAWNTVVRELPRPPADHSSFAEHDRIAAAIDAVIRAVPTRQCGTIWVRSPPACSGSCDGGTRSQSAGRRQRAARHGKQQQGVSTMNQILRKAAMAVAALRSRSG